MYVRDYFISLRFRISQVEYTFRCISIKAYILNCIFWGWMPENEYPSILWEQISSSVSLCLGHSEEYRSSLNFEECYMGIRRSPNGEGVRLSFGTYAWTFRMKEHNDRLFNMKANTQTKSLCIVINVYQLLGASGQTSKLGRQKFVMPWEMSFAMQAASFVGQEICLPHGAQLFI